jgi:hypothetical protein
MSNPTIKTITPAPPLSNHEAFMLLVSDSAGVTALLDYLKSMHCEHHLVFWQEVQDIYHKQTNSTERNKLSEDMWHRYGKNGSHSQINITEPQRLRIQNAIEKIGTIGQRNIPLANRWIAYAMCACVHQCRYLSVFPMILTFLLYFSFLCVYI